MAFTFNAAVVSDFDNIEGQSKGEIDFGSGFGAGDGGAVLEFENASGGLDLDADPPPTLTIGGVEEDGYSVEVVSTSTQGGQLGSDQGNNRWSDVGLDTGVDVVVITLADGTQYVIVPSEPGITGAIGGGSAKVGEESGEQIVVCFVEGTMIVTDRGEVAVENLGVGDMVLTRDEGFQPIRWIGASRVRRNAATAPVRVRAGTFGEGRPVRDLRVSPQHRLLTRDARLDLYFGVGEALVPARHLIDGDAIRQELDGPDIWYFHILFDTHQVIYSDGLPTESFHPGSWGLSALGEETRAEVLALFPQLADAPESYGPPARISLKSFEVAALRN